MKFAPRTSGNPAGRPVGVRATRRAAMVAAFNRTIEPHAEELMQRALSQALSGDAQALTGLLALIGCAMTGSASTARNPSA